MTASELAFLALGLLLGVATGAALLVAVGGRLGRREILVTVTRDAVRRRSGTLSQDAFVTRPAQPAQGGPGDRRWADRDHDEPAEDDPPARPALPASRPAMAVERAYTTAMDRTPVPYATGAVGIAVERQSTVGTPLERILRGEHRAMVEVVDSVAGDDSRQRRTWELLLGGLVDALNDIAVRESVIDFPMGTAFWDTFTIEQCRRVVGALRSMGYRYDGVAGWADGHVPSYRDLTMALADIGVEPRRVRAWPNQSEIANLFAGARPAPEELLPAAGPDYTAEAMQALLDERADDLPDLWLTWESIRPALLVEPVNEVA